VDTKWRDGARLAEGKFLVIDQDRAVTYIEAPQDKDIARLSEQLNGTYLAYGKDGEAGRQRQDAQDRNALSVAPSGAVVARAAAKASGAYQNGGWDLVDAAKEKKVAIGSLKTEELPAVMQTLNTAERTEFVSKKAKERETIQLQINTLTAAREQFVAGQAHAATNNTLDTAIISTVREQARGREFRFD
jgi:hypothetical protein